VETYKEIYGHAKGDRKAFLKSDWYTRRGEEPNVVSVLDPVKHSQMRKSLSHAFSARALRLQTDVVIQYVDHFIEQIFKYGNQEKGIPSQEWYNWLTFDIIGDLAFGEPFDAVTEGNCGKSTQRAPLANSRSKTQLLDQYST